MNNSENKTRYYLASFSSRAKARLIDLLIITLIQLFFVFLCFINTEISIFKIGSTSEFIEKVECYRYFLVCLLYNILIWSYFVLIPFFWNNQTIGMKVVKIKIVSVSIFSKKFVVLAKREAFITLLSGFILLIISIILFSAGDYNASIIVSNIILGNDKKTPYDTWMLILYVVLTVSYFFTFIIFIFMLFDNKKRSIHDNISESVTIDLKNNHKDIDPMNNVRTKTKKLYDLPGEVKSIDFGELE